MSETKPSENATAQGAAEAVVQKPGQPPALARRLRIIQVFNQYRVYGGEEKSVGRIADDLASAGHRVARYWRSSNEWQDGKGPSKLGQALALWNNSEALGRLEELQIGRAHV